MDPSFPYAIYTQRVRSGEIYVEKIQGDSALLHITELQDRDTGVYECHTPTTDERYFGSYSAKMNLIGKVFVLQISSYPGQSLCLEPSCLDQDHQFHITPLIDKIIKVAERVS